MVCVLFYLHKPIDNCFWLESAGQNVQKRYGPEETYCADSGTIGQVARYHVVVYYETGYISDVLERERGIEDLRGQRD